MNISNKIPTSNECAISFGEEYGDGETEPIRVAQKYICPPDKPICSNYTPNVKWGTCGINSENNGNNAVVLGNYNMHPWNVNDTWLDENAKWIWFEDNADRIAMPSSTITFYYKYFKESDNDHNIQIHIASRKLSTLK